MTRQMLRAKVHRITVTDRNVEYDGSLTLDVDLMEAADLQPYERIEVYNIANGERFATYVIEGQRSSGVCCVNGAAAHLVRTGHRLIIASYAAVQESEVRDHRPRIVLIGENNRAREMEPADSGVRTA